MAYREIIQEIVPGANARHVEAWMRCEYGTLCHLSPFKFTAAALEADRQARADPALAERLAATYGLGAPKSTI